jgi:hypothetical protein
LAGLSYPIPDSGGTQLFVTAECIGTSGCPYDNAASAPSPYTASAGLYSADILLESDGQPGGTNFGGTLLQARAHGTADLAFSASDLGGPGVYKVTVLIDDKVMYQGTPNANGGKCSSVGTDPWYTKWAGFPSAPSTDALVFDYEQPCLQSETVDLPISTLGLADGVHHLQVNVADAAENTATVLDTTISTRQPVASGPLYAFRLNALSGRLTTHALRRSYRRSGFVFSGVLLSPAGVPASGVNVVARARSSENDALSIIASTTTDATGRFSLSVPRGVSRLVDVIAGSGIVAVKEYVRPNISLRVSSVPGDLLLFTGHVSVAPLGSPRPLVVISDRTDRGWQQLGTVRVGVRGSFRYVYKASRLLTGYRFSFRASSPATASWATGSSPARLATIR